MSKVSTEQIDKAIADYHSWRQTQDLPPYNYLTKKERTRAREEQDRAYDTYRDNIYT